MKSIVSVLIVLIWLSNYSFVLSAHFFQDNTHLKYLTKFASDQPTLQHRMVKRQISAPTTGDKAICDAKLNDVTCTAGVQQGLVETALSCNGTYKTIQEAQRRANLCAKGEGGQFCGSLWERYKIRSNYNSDDCSRVLIANSCPSSCRSLLEDFRSTFGCCINAYVNGTGPALPPPSYSLDYRVWNLCNVSLPPASCENGPTINPPANVQNCTDEDLFNKYYAENLCLPERRQAYFDVLESSICEDSTTDIKSVLEDLCFVDTNGIPYGKLYYESSEDLASLDSNCSTSNVSCTSNCKDGITAAKKHYGCCFKSFWFNVSTFTGAQLSASYLSPSVLQSCDIDLPEACEGLIGSAVSIMKTNYISLIVTGLMYLLLITIIA